MLLPEIRLHEFAQKNNGIMTDLAGQQALLDEYIHGIEALQGDKIGRAQVWDYIESSTAIIHGEPVKSSFIPKLYSVSVAAYLEDVAVRIHHILELMTQFYCENEQYRRLFDFDTRLEDLILATHRGPSIPILRIDLFLNEKTGAFKLCELNTDGSAGINEDREVLNALKRSKSFRLFAENHVVRGNDLFDSWITEFCRIVKHEWSRPQIGRVAICDYTETTTMSEIQAYVDAFEAKGIPCSFVDIRNLSFLNGALIDESGMPIDAVWRRCVPSDLLDRWDESQSFLSMVRDGSIPVVSGFASAVAHDKRALGILRHPASREFLSESDAEFVDQIIPSTFILSAQTLIDREVYTDKDRWIVKPVDGYGARDVYAGCAYSQEEWNDILSAIVARNQRFVVQEYVQPYESLLIPAMPIEKLEAYGDSDCLAGSMRANNLTGLYVFNGRPVGIYNRMGERAVITEDYTAASVYVEH